MKILAGNIARDAGEILIDGRSVDISHPADARANGIGILVMGSHGYNRLKTAVMGSTAAALAAHGIVPLLIVKSPKIEKTAVKTAEPAKA